MAALPAVSSLGMERASSSGIGSAATHRRPPQMLLPRQVRSASMVPVSVVRGAGVSWPLLIPPPSHACTDAASPAADNGVKSSCLVGRGRVLAQPKECCFCVDVHSAASPGTAQWRHFPLPENRFCWAPLLCFFVEHCLGNLLLVSGGSGSLACISSSCSSPCPSPQRLNADHPWLD